MSIQWTYGGNPATSVSDALRFAVGDTNASDPLLSDGEVAYVLGIYGIDVDTAVPPFDQSAITQAGVYALESLLVVASRAVDETVGSVSISFSQRLGNIKDSLAILMARAASMGAGGIYAGGISRSDVIRQDVNPDRVRPAFTRRTLEGRYGSLPDDNRAALLSGNYNPVVGPW